MAVIMRLHIPFANKMMQARKVNRKKFNIIIFPELLGIIKLLGYFAKTESNSASLVRT